MKRAKAKKSLGQNFLVDMAAIGKIVGAVPEHAPLVLEIGPGQGALTAPLALRAEKLILIEKDEALLEATTAKLAAAGTPVAQAWAVDALEFEWGQIWEKFGDSAELVVAANLPYNVGTEILFRLLDHHTRIPRMVLMFQKEVAERIVAGPRGRDRGTVSIFAQNLYTTEILAKLKPEAFRPRPKVDSAVVLFERREVPELSFGSPAEAAGFRAFVQTVFRFRRKTLANGLGLARAALAQGPELPDPVSARPRLRDTIRGEHDFATLLRSLGIAPERRPETLSISEWGALYRGFSGGGS